MEVIARKGDSLWNYSQWFRLHPTLLFDSNPTIDSNQLSVGQRIKIPGFVREEYQIKQGESLESIAEDKHLSIETLLLINQTLQEDKLQASQSIHVPNRITSRIVQGEQKYSYEHLINDLNRLEKIYPFIRISSIGNSVLGKDIPEILIGKGNKRVHMNGSFHANEWITTPIIMTFLNDYLLAVTNQICIRGVEIQCLYEQSTMSIVPMVNPDGVNLVLNGPPFEEHLCSDILLLNEGKTDFSGWKANIRGVDLNDQFPAGWEIEKNRRTPIPGPRDYPGEKPLSEPESMAMAELTIMSNFSRVIAFHTQCKEIYWGFENLEPKESEKIANEFARVSGYTPVRNLDSYAGYKDWFIQDFRRPGFTIELGEGTNPLPLSQFKEIYEQALGIFLAGLYL